MDATPNIVLTLPEDVGFSPPIGKIDQTLLHPLYHQQRLPTFCKPHKILTDAEFDEEERYFYGSTTTMTQIDSFEVCPCMH